LRAVQISIKILQLKIGIENPKLYQISATKSQHPVKSSAWRGVLRSGWCV